MLVRVGRCRYKRVVCVDQLEKLPGVMGFYLIHLDLHFRNATVFVFMSICL